MNGTAEGGVMKSETWQKHHLNFTQNTAGGIRYRQVHRLFRLFGPLADTISKCGTCHIQRRKDEGGSRVKSGFYPSAFTLSPLDVARATF
jgi:hypothetical protein